jgi:hypothetical protein
VTTNLSKDEINQILAGSYTPDGAMRWWNRPRIQLDGRSPERAWADGDYAAVRVLVRRLVSGGST